MCRSLSLRSIPLFLALALTAAVAVACGGSSGELDLSDARSRMSPMLTGVGAVYLDITNGTDVDDQLLGATVAPTVAGRVELHETFDADAGHGGMDDGGEMDGSGEMDDGEGMDGEMEGDGEGMADDAEGMADDAEMDGSGEMDGAATEPTPEGFAMMGMREIEALDVPAGATVSLEPGGHHLMLLELAADLVPGESFELTLEFAETGERTVTVEVREDV